MKRYVIIGNGAAGAAAVGEIRARDGNCAITVFSREPHPHYYRPRLPDFIAREAELADFTMHAGDWYESRGVDLRLGESVTSIDPKTREVHTQKSGTFAYDGLLVASGSSGFLPPVDGSDKAGVFTFRTFADAASIREAAGKTGVAVIVGGGLLGLETARALCGLGISVEVLERSERILSRQLDGESSLVLQRKLEGMGLSFRLGAKVSGIVGRNSVRAVALEDGSEIECGLVIFSAGVRPNLELAASAGIEVGRAIKVDAHMATGVPGIWAAGDCTEFEGSVCGLWTVAMEQGSVAGSCMAGDLKSHVHSEPPVSLKVAGVDLVAAGEIDAGKAGDLKVFASGDVYRRIVLEGDVIKGMIFLGSTAGAYECAAAMNGRRRLGTLADGLDRADFDFSALAG